MGSCKTDCEYERATIAQQLERYEETVEQWDCDKGVMFDGLVDEAKKIYRKKNKMYGDSFGLSIERYGLISALTRMSDKWNRIENMILSGSNGTTDERLIDSLADLSNYCIMTIIELECNRELLTRRKHLKWGSEEWNKQDNADYAMLEQMIKEAIDYD